MKPAKPKTPKRVWLVEGQGGGCQMTRFRKAVEEWRVHPPDNIEDVRWRAGEWCEGLPRHPHTYAVILTDVVKAVDAYERTIADLKRQNTKLRKGRRCSSKT